MTFSVDIDLDKCNNCWDCIELCPTEAITINNGKIEYNNTICSYCEVCMDVCPEQAIKVSW